MVSGSPIVLKQSSENSQNSQVFYQFFRSSFVNVFVKVFDRFHTSTGSVLPSVFRKICSSTSFYSATVFPRIQPVGSL